MTAVNVRPADPTDAAALAEVAAATFRLACPPQTTEQAIAEFLRDVLSVECFAEYLDDPTRLVLLAEQGGRPVGYTLLVFGDPGDPDVAAAVGIRPTVELSKCYVLAETQGAGVAAALMAATLDAARQRGAAGAWLGVNEQNARAIRFYEKSGFAAVGRKRFLLGGVYENDHVLERAL
ncbi:GNAT family N-acetyltransferase [Microterricola pindariensis]|uniref:GNAT family N-acetyltransferase n=1 Tax=Microterricola pindariensis TaxID=478010 RepID=A0ABX5AR70_9MICO|nr:GNAT family N-acetyltransferase [Microterricola pindariensis]PPL14455.1 GNAT family N-acetyltransferase [Microterricola pindariensis]